jgi:ribonuclease D
VHPVPPCGHLARRGARPSACRRALSTTPAGVSWSAKRAGPLPGAPRGTLLITDTAALRALCADLRRRPYVAMDTEFMREKTYYPILCLVQLSHGDVAAAVDARAPGIDLSPLRDLLVDPAVVKVMHASSQDMEVLLLTVGVLPRPLFDTQVAAKELGMAAQIGYGDAVSQLLGVSLDKGARRTDWARRPLSERQLEYALSDVTYLCGIYERMRADLDADQLARVHAHMRLLEDARRYQVEPEEAWKRIKLRGGPRGLQHLLREIAAWRERVAMRKDLPRPWIAKDGVIVSLAKAAPRDLSELAAVDGLPGAFARGEAGRSLLEAIARGVEAGRAAPKP